MSYQAQAQLNDDPLFQARNRSAAMEQATVHTDHIADEVKKGNGEITNAFTRLAAAGPGIAAKADNGTGGVDQARVTDGDLLALTQANWPVVAGLYPEGAP